MTNSLEQSHYLKADSGSAGHEITRLLCTKVHYRVHKSPLLDLIMSHLIPVHTLTRCFF